jgi:hypothetical protein
MIAFAMGFFCRYQQAFIPTITIPGPVPSGVSHLLSSSGIGGVRGRSVLALVPEMLRQTKEYEPVVYAVILILVMFLLPGGLITLPAWIRGKIKRG